MDSTTLVLPGDKLPLPKTQTQPIILGPGIYKSPATQEIIPVSAGLLTQGTKKAAHYIYTENNSKRYIPQVNDFVIGVVTGVYGEFYRVALSNFSQTVQLHSLAFENATKKNKPVLKIGNIVYARVKSAHLDIEPEIECVDSSTGKAAGFGLLEGGYLLNDLSLNYTRSLLFGNASLNAILEALSLKCKFEIAIGVNGKIWINAGDGDVKLTLACVKVLEGAASRSGAQTATLIEQTWKEVGI
ncbi:hypothetical protein BABINDRAFT_160697 [Babjeviella inositovora NRRL Y-12698]|uniref:Ribosomal RNA-processing protein 40 n=1 Tax=Babjeviella inositovora NRRL Y-12698 TaxID=984486 RepID=A0A1E3QUI0_9ASCO|nr:uncharacterized protein BABINDRAFT_160697 [Babjeviella inositovora NRRL Y-12698]ODQ81338.1 hypothetical protein BABINDRAFT_160697 [Babjeviella inositovora NRRL Y-12698]